MLLGATLMLAFMRHIHDDGRLIVTPAMRGDSGFAADGRSRAVGGDEKTRAQRICIAQPRIDAAEMRGRIIAASGYREIGHRGGSQVDAELSRLGRERVNKDPIL